MSSPRRKAGCEGLVGQSGRTDDKIERQARDRDCRGRSDRDAAAAVDFDRGRSAVSGREQPSGDFRPRGPPFIGRQQAALRQIVDFGQGATIDLHRRIVGAREDAAAGSLMQHEAGRG
jgi:hypothetical protein